MSGVSGQDLAEADLIIYAPGTQHSSLFPSYLTPGISDAIAGNLQLDRFSGGVMSPNDAHQCTREG
jgi:2-phospho-L-lactate transferase/gluconeogenesis factor (CofD/UPF0052 family)